MLHQEGYGISWAEEIYNSDLEDLYLLFMQDHRIRNSKEWEKSALFQGSGTASYTDSGLSADTGLAFRQHYNLMKILTTGVTTL